MKCIMLDDILMTLRQHSSSGTGKHNENRKPSSLQNVFNLTSRPTSLWFSNGKLKRIFHYNFIDLMNEVSVAIWTVGSPFQLLALSRCCRNANWLLLPPHVRAMAAGAAPGRSKNRLKSIYSISFAVDGGQLITIQYSHTASHWASHTWFMHYTGVGVVQ